MVITWLRLWRDLLGRGQQPDTSRELTSDELQAIAAMCAAMGAPLVLTPRTGQPSRPRHR